jgi:hypothetical protein
MMLEFTGDPRVGRSFALDLSEGTMDEYGAIPGANFEIIIHDGTWPSIIGQLEAAVAASRKDKAAGLPPCVLCIDSATHEWAMLKTWVDTRARRLDRNINALRRNPDAEVVRPRHLWNPVDERHKKFIQLLLRFEGPVLITARGKEVSATGPDGQPVEGKKEYRVDSQKDLAFDATAWVRFSRDEPPTIIGVRSVKWGIRPGQDDPRPDPDFTIGGLIWDVIGCDPKHSQVRDMPALDADQLMTHEQPPADSEDLAKARRNAEIGAQRMLGAKSATEARRLLEITRTNGLGDIDVTEHLTDNDTENLGLIGEEVTLLRLAEKIDGYWTEHKTGPRTPLGPESGGAAA